MPLRLEKEPLAAPVPPELCSSRLLLSACGQQGRVVSKGSSVSKLKALQAKMRCQRGWV